MTGRADRWIRRFTIGCVGMLALIAGTVSYLYMHCWSSFTASLAANVAAAEPTIVGRMIAAWPSFSLIAAYELLMRQVRRSAETAAPRRRLGRLTNPAAATAAASPSEPVQQAGPRHRSAGSPGGTCG